MPGRVRLGLNKLILQSTKLEYVLGGSFGAIYSRKNYVRNFV